MFADTYVFTMQICAGVVAALLTLAALAIAVLFVVNVIRRIAYFRRNPPSGFFWSFVIVYAWSDIWI